MTTQVQCVRIRLNPGMIDRAREWAAVINSRRDEALATLHDEGVTIESVFLERAQDGDYLIYYMRARSFEEAARAVSESQHEIDAYHQRFKREAWASQTELEALVDLDVER